MSLDSHSADEAHERAALYALGALRGDDAREFEIHLAQGCAVCADELAAFTVVTADLSGVARPQAPRETLRARVLQRVAAESALAQQTCIETRGLWFLRSTDVNWQPSGVAAIDMKTLYRDAQRGYSTQLVRMQPGAAYPKHRHAGIEELYLIEGDLLVSGVLMEAGDYCRAEPGSIHDDISTRRGCLFISTASERDELLRD